MLVMVTVMSWVTIGLTLDLLGVFDEDDDHVHEDAEPSSLEPESVIEVAAFLGEEVEGTELTGTPDDDVLTGDDGQDVLIGKGGDDKLYGDAGDDGILGGSGDDILRGGSGSDFLQGNLGTDEMIGGRGDDVLAGVQFGADSGALIDIDEGDEMAGGEGDDTLVLGNSDTATGDQGSDTFSAGAWIKPGEPAHVDDYDETEDTIVFAYDPSLTPAPRFTLDDGNAAGDKVFSMNADPMVHIANAASMTLADVNIIESSLSA